MFTDHPFVHSGLALTVSTALLAAAPAAHAAALEEIVVTAQKRQESLQDVGISVTAFSSNQLSELGATTTTDISQQVPSLQLVTYTPAFTIFSLRGISQNNFQDNLEAPVAVYMDGAYVASMNAIGTRMFDMERVEVLRGPQGTLFGRNSTGGLIHFITHGAEDADTNGYLEAEVADFNKHALEGAIGGGVTDRLRARIAGRWEESDGYVKSITPGIRDAHGANGYSLRGSLQYDFTENFTGDLRVGYAKDDDVPSGAYTVRFASFDPNTGFGIPEAGGLSGNLEHASTLQGGFDREVKYGTGTLTWNPAGGLQVVSITHYLKLDKNYLEDAGGGFGYFPYHTIADFDEFSQELRLSGESDRFRWQVGGYYLDMSWDLFQSVAGALILGGTSDTQEVDTLSVIDSRNWSLFAQGEYDLSDAFTVIAGLRWSQDNKDIEMSRIFEDVPEGIPPTETFNIANVPIPGIDTIDYGDYAARLQLNWTPGEGTLLYASWNRGIKGGNWSIDPLGAVADADLKHREEVLDSYELGWKQTFAKGLARLNAAAFYYDYKDYQTFSLVNLTPQVSNSDANEYGGEIELALSPGEGWDFVLGAAFLDSTVDAVPDVFGGTVKAEFPTAPSVSLNFLGRYAWPMLGGAMSAQIDGVYNDDQYLEGTNSAVSFEKSYAVWNARVDYTTGNDHWNVALWVKNFTDEEYRLYDLDLGLIGFIEQVYAPPRWVGGTVSYRFGE
jgi:iron complex outermembrane recepter protein